MKNNGEALNIVENVFGVVYVIIPIIAILYYYGVLV